MKTKLYLVLSLLMLLSGCRGDIPVTKESAEQRIRSITISCAGDCTLGTDVAFGGQTLPREVEEQEGDYGWFLRNVLPIFGKDDLTMVNLEGTLTKRGTRQEKTYAFRGNPEYVSILTAGSVEAVTLANNHSLDYGEISLADTKEALGTVGVWWVENLHTIVKEIDGVKVGMIGLYDLNGSALNMIPQTMEQVKNEGAELIVVQVHWGIEGEAIPTPRQREIAHAAIDAGADLVMGHHPHVLQGLEEYKGKMIAYSLGNFCFGGNQNPTDKDTMIFQQTFLVGEGKVLPETKWQVYPCSISSVAERNNYQPTPLFGEAGEGIRHKIQERTDAIGELAVHFADRI
ncbi:MAG: CapA family protein [Clostridia bacterium]|nr:CapA family protein [Clostridia bacterium]